MLGAQKRLGSRKQYGSKVDGDVHGHGGSKGMHQADRRVTVTATADTDIAAKTTAFLSFESLSATITTAVTSRALWIN